MAPHCNNRFYALPPSLKMTSAKKVTLNICPRFSSPLLMTKALLSFSLPLSYFTHHFPDSIFVTMLFGYIVLSLYCLPHPRFLDLFSVLLLFLWWGVPLFVYAPNFFNATFHYDGYVSDCTYIIKYFFFFFFPLQNNNFSYKIEGCSS